MTLEQMQLVQGFPYWGNGGCSPPYQLKICYMPPPRKSLPTKFLSPSNQKSIPLPPLNNNFQAKTQ